MQDRNTERAFRGGSGLLLGGGAPHRAERRERRVRRRLHLVSRDCAPRAPADRLRRQVAASRRAEEGDLRFEPTTGWLWRLTDQDRHGVRCRGWPMRTRALAAVIIAAGLGAGCGSPARPHAGLPAGGVVPWADRPAAPYAEPGPRTFASDARPCQPAELRTSPGASGVGL